MKIMIVDDHPTFRALIRTLLDSVGTEFLECEDGREAVSQYAQFRPDVVLMDISMADLDGLEATARIRKQSPGARIYMLTQYDDLDLREAARQAGASGYLLKDDLSPLLALLRANSNGSA